MVKISVLFCLFIISGLGQNIASAQMMDGSTAEKARITATPWEQVRKDKWRAFVENAPIFVFIGTTKDVHFRMERECTSGTEGTESLVWRAGKKVGRRINCYGEVGTSTMPPQIEQALKPLPQPIAEHLEKTRKKKEQLYNSLKRVSSTRFSFAKRKTECCHSVF